MDGLKKIAEAISSLEVQLTVRIPIGERMFKDSSQTLRDFEILLNVTVYFFFSFRIISFLLRGYFFSPDQQQCDREFFLQAIRQMKRKGIWDFLFSSRLLLCRHFFVPRFQFIANKCFHLFWRSCFHLNSQTYYERFIFSSWAIGTFFSHRESFSFSFSFKGFSLEYPQL